MCICRRGMLKLEYTNAGLSLLISICFLFLFQAFATTPYVFVTAVQRVTNKHDAASVWAEDITRFNFRACLRELKNFDGAHKDLFVVSSELRLSYVDM